RAQLLREFDVVSDLHDDDVDSEDEVDDANRVVGGLSRNVLTYLAKQVVEETEERRNSVTLRLHVGPNDMGRVIGRRGRVAQAIRSVVRAAGAKEGVEAT